MMLHILTQSLNASEIHNTKIKDRVREREKTNTKHNIMIPPTTQE